MKDINIRYLDMGRRARDFTAAHGAAFPAGSRAGELVAALNAAVTAIETAGAKQDAAEVAGKQATEQKDVAREVLLDRMRPINRTARGMDKIFPGIGEQFAMPRTYGDQAIINRAQAYITAGTPMAAEFTKRGLDANFLTELAAAIPPMMNAIEQQNNARSEQTAATAAVTKAQTQLKDAVRELSPIVRNTFHDDAATLAAWDSASHVEKAPKKKKTAAPPPPPPPVK
jgi:hypothetical protein